MRRPAWGNANTVVMHEMDMMGRVYRTYYDKKGLHHWAIEKEPGGNILALSSSTDDTFMENEIVEIDRFTGEAVKEINMNQLLPEKYITRNDWAHINSIEYIAKDDSVVISMRNVHTIAKISLEKGELVWILTNPKFYKETNVEDKVLKPEGDIKWFFQQHAIQIVHDEKNKDGRLHIMLFDNHTANRRPVKWFDKEKKSNIMFFTIDEKNMTVTQDKYIPVPLSVTRSNEEYDTKTGKVFAMCANLKPPIDGYNGKIYEIDYNTGEITNEFSSELDYFSAHSIEFNINDMAKPLDFSKDMVVGELYAPVKAEGNAEDFTKMFDFDDIETIEGNDYSDFSLPTANEELDECAATDEEGLPEDELMNIFNRVKEYFNKDSDNKASLPSPSQPSGKGTTDRPEHRESANISRVFSFSSLDDITNAACIIDTFYKDSNSVYKNPSDRRYYLCISKTKCNSKDFNKVCNILSEYGQKESGFDNHIGFFAEHCECIIAEHALHILRRL